ncbi:MAG: hypothetical protein ABI565_07815 [Vicinamibacteria bacterium]
MSTREILAKLTLDERDAFLLMTPSGDPENLVDEAFAAAVTFGDPASIRDLRLRLARAVRDRELGHAIQTLRTFGDDEGEVGVRVRRMLREYDATPCLPEAADQFVRAFALIAARCLHDSKSRAGQRRGQLIKALLDEAAIVEKENAA